VLGRPRPTGRDEEAVVLGALAIAALNLGVVEGGVDDGGAQMYQVTPGTAIHDGTGRQNERRGGASGKACQGTHAAVGHVVWDSRNNALPGSSEFRASTAWDLSPKLPL